MPRRIGLSAAIGVQNIGNDRSASANMTRPAYEQGTVCTKKLGFRVRINGVSTKISVRVSDRLRVRVGVSVR